MTRHLTNTLAVKVLKMQTSSQIKNTALSNELKNQGSRIAHCERNFSRANIEINAVPHKNENLANVLNKTVDETRETNQRPMLR